MFTEYPLESCVGVCVCAVCVSFEGATYHCNFHIAIFGSFNNFLVLHYFITYYEVSYWDLECLFFKLILILLIIHCLYLCMYLPI